jgi:DNA-binding NarL/FixJ family response regulator
VPTAAGAVVRAAVLSGRRILRDALAAWLARQAGFTMVGHVGDHHDLLALYELSGPDLVIADAGGAAGAALARLADLRARCPRLRVVLLYERLSPAELAVARLGAQALVPLSSGLGGLLVVLRQAAEAARAEPPEGGRPDGRLTGREHAIIALIGAGHTVQRIAGLLGTTPCAVENAKRQIYRKFGVFGQSQVIARAAALGLLDLPAPAGSAPPAPRAARAELLTPREKDILRSIARGDTVRQTARALTIAEKTVENTQARLFLKLGTHSRAGAVAIAYRLGLLDVADN